VDYAHKHGVLHRDLKPSNLLLHADGDAGDVRVLLTDFGLASRHLDGDEGLMGRVRGTYDYMAPELFSSDHGAVDVTSDVYSLGVILYELLAGEPPFGRPPMTDIETARTLKSQSSPRLRVRRPDAPRDLEAICDKCLDNQPENRYRSAYDLHADLHRFLNGQSVAARPLNPLAKLSKGCRRRPVVASLLAALALTFVCGSVGILQQWQRAERNLAQSRQHLHDAQEMLTLLGWALDENFFWNDSNYQFDAEFRQSLASEFQRLVEHEQQFPASPEVLAMAHRRLAQVVTAQGDRQAVDAHYRQSVALWRDLFSQQPDNRIVRRSLALTLHFWAEYRMKGSGTREQVADLLKGELVPDFSLRNSLDRIIAEDFADLMFRRGQALRKVEAVPAAVGTLEAALDLYVALRKTWPEQLSYLERMAGIYQAIGECYEHLGRLAAGEFNYVESRRVYEQLATLPGRAPACDEPLAKLNQAIGSVRLRRGDTGGGMRALEAAMRIYAQRAKQDRADTESLRQAADLSWKAATAGYQGWTAHDVYLTWQRCCDFHIRLQMAGKLDAVRTKRLAASHQRFGDAQLALGKSDEALASLAASVACYDSFVQPTKERRATLVEYADTLRKLADMQQAKGDRQAARLTMAKVVRTYEAAEQRNRDYLVVTAHLDEARKRLASL
jgi:tetratricopeptide (TPR) repeat protein